MKDHRTSLSAKNIYESNELGMAGTVLQWSQGETESSGMGLLSPVLRNINQSVHSD